MEKYIQKYVLFLNIFLRYFEKEKFVEKLVKNYMITNDLNRIAYRDFALYS